LKYNSKIDFYLSTLTSEKVVIDCGHVPVTQVDGDFELSPSPSQIETLRIGCELYKTLIEFGKKPIVNVCFSDTTRFIGSSHLRKALKLRCMDKSIKADMPASYSALISQIAENDISFTLQTVNSNRFTSKIKRVKKDIRNTGNPEVSYEKYNALFARDNKDVLFCFTNEFLLNPSPENDILGGDWWLNEFAHLRDLDKVRAPVAPLKKIGIIALYSKTVGILCPATYAGLVIEHPDDCDHICVYSRKDDPDIGEKIIRGVISACVLNGHKFQKKKFLQILLDPNLENPLGEFSEISLLTSDDFKIKELGFEALSYIFNERLSFRYDLFR